MEEVEVYLLNVPQGRALTWATFQVSFSEKIFKLSNVNNVFVKSWRRKYKKIVNIFILHKCSPTVYLNFINTNLLTKYAKMYYCITT